MKKRTYYAIGLALSAIILMMCGNYFMNSLIKQVKSKQTDTARMQFDTTSGDGGDGDTAMVMYGLQQEAMAIRLRADSAANAMLMKAIDSGYVFNHSQIQ